MFLSSLALPIAAALAIGAGPALANDWYVDANGTPPGTGTQMDPYTSIQFAHDQAATVDFDTLLVAPGTYFENVTLSKLVTVRASGGAEVTTLRPAAAGPILTLLGGFDVIVEGFLITGVSGPPSTEHVQSFEGQILRCIIQGNPQGGFVGFRTTGGAVIVDCTIVGHDVGVEQSNGFGTLTVMRNTLVWNRNKNFLFLGGAFPNIDYCAIGDDNTFSGTGNVAGNPGLCYGWTGDAHLLASSPCIDAGDPALPNDPNGSRSDIGCLPFDPLYVCAPFTEFCPGDGSGAACPCANEGLAGRGCDNSQAGTGGALIYAHGSTNPDAVVLRAYGEMPTALTIFLQGNATSAPGVPFGDGLRCAGGILKRLYTKNASGGAVHAPQAGDLSIKARSAALGDPISGGERRYYQTYYRDANASFCPSPQGNTFNASSGVKIVW